MVQKNPLCMSKNPFLNAGAAAVYIVAIASLMQFLTKFAPPKDSLLAPIAVLSLFTLSAGVMGYLFLSEPIQMYLANEKKKAVSLFVQTLFVFAGITAAAIVLLFVRI